MIRDQAWWSESSQAEHADADARQPPRSPSPSYRTCVVGTVLAPSWTMPNKVDALRLMRKYEVEACAQVTRLCTSKDTTAREHRYEGMLLCEVRVGVPLVLVLDGRRRLVTSMIQRVGPVADDVVEVQTSNSRYAIRRFTMRSARPA
jgi:hypothetical protein